jgi:hypothetical protein
MAAVDRVHRNQERDRSRTERRRHRFAAADKPYPSTSRGRLRLALRSSLTPLTRKRAAGRLATPDPFGISVTGKPSLPG